MREAEHEASVTPVDGRMGLGELLTANVPVVQECLNTTYGLGHFERAYKASAADIYTAHKLIKVRG